MDTLATSLPAFELVAAFVVAALVEVVKATGTVADRWLPVVSIVFGIVVASLWVATAALTWPIAVFGGLVAGLTASGLYSGQKAVRGG